jgi:hypothetical protein
MLSIYGPLCLFIKPTSAFGVHPLLGLTVFYCLGVHCIRYLKGECSLFNIGCDYTPKTEVTHQIQPAKTDGFVISECVRVCKCL